MKFDIRSLKLLLADNKHMSFFNFYWEHNSLILDLSNRKNGLLELES